MTALKLFQRTSSRRSFTLASWHSPHSLTWSWILRLSWGGYERAWSLPVAHAKRDPHFGWGLTLGFRRLLLFYSYRHNGGRQWGLSILGADLDWSRQQPMWFRDMYWREQNAKEEASRQRGLMRQFGGRAHDAP